jgi:hypothetical protein
VGHDRGALPKAKDAPECLWRAIKGYLNLQGKSAARSTRTSRRRAWQI